MISLFEYHRGDVWFADLGENDTHEQRGIRPVLIIQNDVGNQYSPTVIVAALTSREKKNMPTHICFKGGGLPKCSTIMCEQIFTIDKKRLINYVGHLPAKVMEKVRAALRVSLAL